jgi:hypothetical protein
MRVWRIHSVAAYPRNTACPQAAATSSEPLYTNFLTNEYRILVANYAIQEKGVLYKAATINNKMILDVQRTNSLRNGNIQSDQFQSQKSHVVHGNQKSVVDRKPGDPSMRKMSLNLSWKKTKHV